MEKTENYTDKNGVISVRKLGILQYSNKASRRVKSVLSPSAQTNILYGNISEPGEINDTIWDCISMIKEKDLKLWAVVYLLNVGVLRISEVLAISVYDVSMSGHVCIKAKKGSNDKVIHLGEAMEYMVGCKRKGVEPFDGYDRHYVYRQLKKMGISFQSVTSSKASVTHSMRHRAIESMREVGIKDEEIQVISGHKSSKNVKLYGNKK